MDQLSAARSSILNGKSAVLVVHCHLSSSPAPSPSQTATGRWFLACFWPECRLQVRWSKGLPRNRKCSKMSSEVSQCWAFSTHHRKMQPKHGTNLRIVHWLNLKLYLKRKFPSQHNIVDTFRTICIETPSNLTCELKLDSLGSRLVLLNVLIVDYCWSSCSLPKFPVLTTSCTKWTAMATKSWTSCRIFRRNDKSKNGNAHDDSWTENRHNPNKRVSVACRTMSCYRYHSCQDVFCHQTCTISEASDGLMHHFQLHDTFKLPWSLSHCLAMSFS